jgi:hypothetical protein
MTVLSPSQSPSIVAAVYVVVDSPTVLPNAVTPATTRGGTKRTSGDRLTNQNHNIRRRKGIVLNEARILGFLREPFTALLKLSGKAMIDAKGLKRVANSNFELTFNPGSIKTKASRRTSPIPMRITQSQTNPDDDVSVSTPVVTNLPHVVPSHDTVETMNYRRYLLEDIMMAPLSQWIILILDIVLEKGCEEKDEFCKTHSITL